MKLNKIYAVEDVIIVVEFFLKQSDEKIIVGFTDLLYKVNKGIINDSDIHMEFYKILIKQERKYPNGKYGYRGVFIDRDGTPINYSCYNHFPLYSCTNLECEDYTWIVQEDFYMFTDVKFVTKTFLNEKLIPRDIYKRFLFSLNEWNSI